MFLNNRHLRAPIVRICKHFQHTQAHAVTLSHLPNGPVFRSAQLYPDRTALRDGVAAYTYSNLFMSANELAKDITKLVNGRANERVLFLCPNDANYVITLWAIWLSGQIAVPLSPQHPKNLILYYANDTKSGLFITTSEYAELAQKVVRNTGGQLHVLHDKMRLRCTRKSPPSSQSDLEGNLPKEFYDTSDGMILYTSGTTGSPKGVVITHKNLQFQTSTLIDAWKWSQNDVILHTLPLHHTHGVVNALLCPLQVGAKTLMLKKFDANTVWSHLLGINAKPDDRRITLYMAVPTIYTKLIEEYDKVFKHDAKMADHIRSTLKTKLRLMVSGSAPLPGPIFEKWREISGHELLERYGMTEIGMALSNLYKESREPGYVGQPLPGVSVKLVEDDAKTGEQKTILECATDKDGKFNEIDKVFRSENHKGELLVKSDGVFKEYYRRPEATQKEFTSDKWFKTGDVCEYSQEKKKFKILGRKSVDIIKTGGHKVSAIEIETQLLGHPDIKECAVVGLDNEKWGQLVAAVVVLKEGSQEVTPDSLKVWAKDSIPNYSLPRIVKLVPSIQKNAMGKINKKELLKEF